MSYRFKLIKCFVFVIGLVAYSEAACNIKPPDLANGNYSVVVHQEYVVYYCSDSYQFTTGDTVIASTCLNNGTWKTVANCSQQSGSGSITTSCSGSPVAPTDSTKVTVEPSTKLMAYQCVAGKSFLSGEPARMSQCKDGNWTTIWDICDEGCAIPRDCSDVAALGLNETADYYVIPSGNRYGKIYLVHCELNSTADMNGANWTYIFKTDMSIMTNSSDAYINGIRNWNSTTYFVGLQFLSDISLKLPDDNDTVGMVLEVLFFNSNDQMISWATYGNFTVGNATQDYAITSLGKYHGMAGDAFCPQLNSPFVFAASDAMWWGSSSANVDTIITPNNGSFLTKSGKWTTLSTSLSPTRIVMRIRPTSEDRELFCPPMVGYEYWWNNTNASIPFTRKPGTNVTWQCFGEMIMEGVEGGTRTYAGTSECMAGSPPYWSYNVTLPCTMTCPQGFLLNANGTGCFHYSLDLAVGIIDAAEKCNALNASLALLNDSTDFEGAENLTSYYTAYSARGSLSNGTLSPPLPTSVLPNCTAGLDCGPQNGSNCTVVQKPSFYGHVSCIESYNYVCHLPDYCPLSSYLPAEGACYRIVDATNFTEALLKCTADGGSLAYPTSISRAEILASHLLANVLGLSTSAVMFFVGLNNIGGDWTVDSQYAVGDLATHLGTVAPQWTVMEVFPNGSYEFIPADIFATGAATKAVCQLFGVLECSVFAPAIGTNMERYDTAGNSTLEGATAFYKCYPGYFMYLNMTITNMTSVCLGALGGVSGWYPPIAANCEPLPVCKDSLPNVTSSLMTNTTIDPGSFYLNGTILFTCYLGMGMATNKTEENATCMENPNALGTYMYYPSLIPDCDACLEPLWVVNATLDWTLDTTTSTPVYKTIGENVTATCYTGFEYAFNSTIQHIICHATGWNMTGIVGCYRACVNAPPAVAASDNMTAPNVTSNTLGSVLLYNCTPGYHVVLTENNTVIATQIEVACNSSGMWEEMRTPMQCAQFCLDNPPAAPPNATSDWNGVDRSVGLQVVYTADPGFLFGNFSTTWTIFCNGSHWLPIDNSSTSPTGIGNYFVCRQVCMQSPPTAVGGATPLNWTGPYGFVGEQISYICPAGQANATGIDEVNITCDTTGNWTDQPDYFLCENACIAYPPATPLGAVDNFTGDFREGVMIVYSCEGGFADGVGRFIHINCTSSGTWSHSFIPSCLAVTIPPTTTFPPYIFPLANSDRYEDTTDFYIPDLGSSLYPASGIENDFLVVNSLVGFGYAVGVRTAKQQCLVKEQYVPNDKQCEINPKNCTDGLSVSLWARIYYEPGVEEDFNNVQISDERYLLSTGADKQGHPGVAIGLRKIWLFAIVSTGDKYWEVSVLGPLANNTWNNVALRWTPNTILELYVNNTKIGSTDVAVSTTPLPIHNPPLLMIGCHRSSNEAQYRGYANADLDEFAVWTQKLPDDKTSDFMGGFAANVSEMTAAEFAFNVLKSDLTNSDQLSAASSIMADMTLIYNEEPPASAAPTDGTPTPTSPTATPASAEDVKNLRVFGYTQLALMDVKNLPNNISTDEAEKRLNVMKSFSNLLSQRNLGAWREIQKDTENLGVMQLVAQSRKYQSAVMSKIRFGNQTLTYCYEILERNLYTKSCKLKVSELRTMNSKVQLPDYRDPLPKQMKEDWEEPTMDRIAFPTDLGVDPVCDDLLVSFTIQYHRYAAKAAQTCTNAMSISDNAVKVIDSRLLVLDVLPDLAQTWIGQVDTSHPYCTVNKFELGQRGVVMKLAHDSQLPAKTVSVRRSLKLFENMKISDIKERFCVWWNTNISDYGGWDGTGCEMTQTTEDYSQCSCNNIEIYVILATKTDPIEIPAEPQWLALLKYVLYGISAVAIGLYILVVFLSGELKDQFHLIGLNMAVAILCGSVAMVLSDFDNIAGNRTMCTIFGTLIHVFYGAVGVWMVGLGHASFKGITAGVIGGRLTVYMGICWGIALGTVGIPFLFMLPDLGFDPRCFIGWENNVKWVFFFPQILYLILGIFFALVVLCNVSNPALRKDNLIEDYGSFCRGAALLILHLSVTWGLGVLAYIRFSFTEPNFYPIFQVLNAISGLMLFLFIGFGSKRFRGFLLGQAQARRELLKNYAFGFPSADGKTKLKFPKIETRSPTDK